MPTHYLGRGDDVFVISGDSVSVYGQGGNDTISGSGDHLLVDGGAGVDQLAWNNSSYSTVVGGPGDDNIASFDYHSTNNVIYAGTGSDVVRVDGRYNTVYGGSGDDSIRTESSLNVYFGGDGNDTISGVVAGRLTLDGGNGDDALIGLGSNNIFRGDRGEDSLTLVEGNNNHLYGGLGEDTLTGSDGSANEFCGGAGDDTLTASFFLRNSTLRGGAGNDELIAHSADNTLDGGAGEDHLSSFPRYSPFGSNVFTGGGGRDHFYFEHFEHLSVTNDANLVLSQGDVITGEMDRITDYKASETLDLPGQGLVRAASVRLADPAPGPDQGHRHVVLAAQTYAVLDGDLTAPDAFTLSATGQDKLVVYGGSNYPEDAGAVVLENFDGDVLIA